MEGRLRYDGGEYTLAELRQLFPVESVEDAQSRNGETIVPPSGWDNLPITLVKTGQASRRSRDTRGNHTRAPDLSPNIKVVFPEPARTEYIGVY